MIASKDSLEPKSSDYVMPNSRRVYVEGELHPDVRVPFREISQANTKAFNGTIEPNEPIRVYDCSGPWGDPAQTPDSAQGLTPIRAEWIARRGDVAEYDGREVKPRTTATSRAATKSSPAPPSAESPRALPRRETPPAPRRQPATPSRSSGMRARASSRPRWNSSPSARTRAARSNHRRANIGRAASVEPWPESRHLLAITTTPGESFGAAIPKKSPPSSSAPKSPVAAPSSRPISTIPSSSR
jgi:hypothetical protein